MKDHMKHSKMSYPMSRLALIVVFVVALVAAVAANAAPVVVIDTPTADETFVQEAFNVTLSGTVTVPARAVDVGVATITFEVTGPPERLADFLQLMNVYGIVSLAKSGRIALPRDQKSAKKQLQSA